MASGGAARFGSNKLLHPVDGVPMIQRAFSAVPACLFEEAVVVSRYPDILELAEGQGYRPVCNPWAEEGQSASIRLGLAPLRGMDGALFAVCDQPWLTRESVTRLLEAFSNHPGQICSLSWQGRRGSPSVFPAALFPALLSLTGDQRGGTVIQTNRNMLRLVDAGSPRELYDVDAPEDLSRA